MTSILKKVIADYTAIADEFDITRKSSWPEFMLFEKALVKSQSLSANNKTKIKLLDVGCGNGRLFDFLDHKIIDYTGADNNSALLRIAKKNNPKARFKKADMLSLGYKSNQFDSVWCIAALHHLPTQALQKKVLVNIKKILKKGGTLMITVWNLWQPKYKKLIDIKTHHSYIPWGNPVKAERFYYAFTIHEFEKLLKEAGFSTLKKISTRPNIAYVCIK